MKWRNWLCALIGAWFIVSPWVLRISHEATATKVSVIVGAVQVIVSIWAAQTFVRPNYKIWQNWVALICGFWFVIHPFLGDFELGQYYSIVVPGLITIIFGFWTLMTSSKIERRVSRF